MLEVIEMIKKIREKRYGKMGDGVEVYNVKEYSIAGLKRALSRILRNLDKEEVLEFIDTYWDGNYNFNMCMGDNSNYLYIVDITDDHLYIYIWESDEWTDVDNDFFNYKNY